MNDAREERYVFGSGVFAYAPLLAIALFAFVLLGWAVFDADPGRLLAIVAAVLALVFLWWLIGPVTIVDGPGRQVIESPGLLPLFPCRTWPSEAFNAVILKKPRDEWIADWTVSLARTERDEFLLQRYCKERSARTALQEVAVALDLPMLDRTSLVAAWIDVDEIGLPLARRLVNHPEQLQYYARIATELTKSTGGRIEEHEGELRLRLRPARVMRAMLLLFLNGAPFLLALWALIKASGGQPYGDTYLALICAATLPWLVWGTWEQFVMTVGELTVAVGPRRVLIGYEAFGRIWRTKEVATAEIMDVRLADSDKVVVCTATGKIAVRGNLSVEQKEWLCAALSAAVARQGKAPSQGGDRHSERHAHRRALDRSMMAR